MIPCKQCGKRHKDGHPHLVSKISDSGFPTHDRRYPTAHEEADKKEKRKYPKGYEKMKKIDESVGKHELVGKNSKAGNIQVSKKVPKELREEVAFHEKTENKILREKKNAHNKST